MDLEESDICSRGGRVNGVDLEFDPPDFELAGDASCVSLEWLGQPKAKKCALFNIFTLAVVLTVRHANNNNKEKNKVISKQNGLSANKPFDRQMTVMCVNSKMGNNSGIILISTTKNESEVFANNIGARDNAYGFGPGAVIAIVNPMPVNDWFGSDNRRIPIINFSGGMYLVSRSRLPLFRQIPVNSNLGSDQKLSGFELNQNVTLQLYQVNFINSFCKGFLCDCLDVRGDVKSNVICACYKHTTESCPILFGLRLNITYEEKDKSHDLEPDIYVSRSFTNFLTGGGVPEGTTISDLMRRHGISRVSRAIQSLFNAGNQRGKWTVGGWYRRGRTADAANNSGDGHAKDRNTVVASNLTYHISYVRYNGNVEDLGDHIIDMSELETPADKRRRLAVDLTLTNNSNSHGGSGGTGGGKEGDGGKEGGSDGANGNSRIMAKV